MSPPVASASAAAEANGVWTPGSASAMSDPASRTRRLRSRFSLLVYVEAASQTRTPVMTRPRTAPPTGGTHWQGWRGDRAGVGPRRARQRLLARSRRPVGPLARPLVAAPDLPRRVARPARQGR